MIHTAYTQTAHMCRATEVLDEFYGDGGLRAELSRSPWDMSFDPPGAVVLERALKKVQLDKAQAFAF